MVPTGNRTTPRVLVWSAIDENALNRMITDYLRHFSSLPSSQGGIGGSYLKNLAFTLGMKRTAFSWRASATIRSLDELHNLPMYLSKPTRSTENPRLGFVFTGQGAQWFAMGRELLDIQIFKHALLQADLYLKECGCQWDVIGNAPIPALQS